MDRSSGELVFTIKETGAIVPLYQNIYDTGVVPVTFGDHSGAAAGGADQLAFALLYDISENKTLSTEKYPELARLLKHAVPEVIELASTDLTTILSN